MKATFFLTYQGKGMLRKDEILQLLTFDHISFIPKVIIPIYPNIYLTLKSHGNREYDKNIKKKKQNNQVGRQVSKGGIQKNNKAGEYALVLASHHDARDCSSLFF